MKKLLALVLALVMTMSLVTISNAAFNDASEISNKEAVEVMNKVGVLAGYDNGDFGAKDTLTRAQAAKIVAYLDLGQTTADAIVGTGTVFTDVKATAWYAGYVEYCAGAGYVAGIGDGKFAPDEKVTGVQFAKMLLGALGYKADVEGYTGGDYTINIARDANKNELYKDTNATAIAVLNREQAAQMAFNALKATVVEYEGGTNVSTSDGTKVVINAKRSEVALSTSNYDQRTGTGVASGAGTQQLCEKLYGGSKGLKLVDLSGTDDFGRPADYKWTYDGKDAYKAYKAATFTYTAKVSDKDLLKDLKGYELANGTKIANESDVTALNVTANGKLVELYFDDSNKYEQTVAVEYTLAKVTDVSTNKDGDVTYTLDTVSGTFVDYADNTAKDDTVILAGKVAEDDYVTVFKTSGGTAYVYPTTKIVGAQSQKTDKTATVSGTEYKLALGVKVSTSANVTAAQFANSSDNANYYFDQYGYLVKTDAIESTKDYAVVDAIAMTVGNGIDAKTVKANIILADGTKQTVEVSKVNGLKVSNDDFTKAATSNDVKLTWSADAKSIAKVAIADNSADNSALTGKVVTYKEKDGKYELTFINLATASANAAATFDTATTFTSTATTSTAVTAKGSPVFANSKVATLNTKYVVKSMDGTDTKFTAYTGYSNIPTIKANSNKQVTFQWVVDDDAIVFVYVNATAAESVGDTKDTDIFYATSSDVTVIGSGDSQYFTMEGILNGEKTTIKSETKSILDNLYANTYLWALKVDDKGYVITGSESKAIETVTAAAKNGVIVGTNTYAYDGSETVIVIDDGEVVGGGIASAKVGDGIFVKVVDSNGTAAEKVTVKTIYIFK